MKAAVIVLVVIAAIIAAAISDRPHRFLAHLASRPEQADSGRLSPEKQRAFESYKLDHVDHIARWQDENRDRAIEMLNQTWDGYCEGPRRLERISAIREYYFHRTNHIAVARSAFGSAGEAFMTAHYDTVRDHLADELLRQVIRDGYLTANEIGLSRPIVSAILLGERPIRNPCQLPVPLERKS